MINYLLQYFVLIVWSGFFWSILLGVSFFCIFLLQVHSWIGVNKKMLLNLKKGPGEQVAFPFFGLCLVFYAGFAWLSWKIGGLQKNRTG